MTYDTSHLFSFENIDFTHEPLFFGSGRNIARLELNIEQNIQKKTDIAVGAMWFKGDFPYSQDVPGYISLPKTTQRFYLKNLKFQTTADSLAARGVAEVFLPCVTNPQLEVWFLQHAFFEGVVHSPTYAEIVKALPLNAKDEFDDIIINENILSRFRDIIYRFEHTVRMNSRMVLSKTDDSIKYSLDDHKRSLVLSLYALNILEAVLFKSSFISTFAFKENGFMTNSVDAVAKIAQDEINHYGMTVHLINTLRQHPDWIHIFSDVRDTAIQMYRDAVDADLLWVDYLFEEDVQLFGLNDNILKEYIKHNIYNVTRSIGFDGVFDKVANPCTWANVYTRPSNIQVAQKEKVSGNYKLGITDTHISEEEWENMP